MSEDIQTKQIELKMIDYQLRQLQGQLQQLDNDLMEIEMIRTNLDDLKNSKKGSEILAPIANGLFVRADLKENDEVLVNVGGNVTVKKNVEESKGILKERIEEVSKIRKELLEAMEKLGKQAMVMEEELSKK